MMPFQRRTASKATSSSGFVAESKGLVVLTGNSHPDLVKRICKQLTIQPCKSVTSKHSNRETKVEIEETVRGRDVYLIQTGTLHVNDDIMELLILAFACKAACARRVILVVPYLPYCKQNKMRKRGSITCKLIAQLICSTGIDHVITIDLHSKEIQGFFDVPVDNLRASPFLIRYIMETISDHRNCVIVAKDPNSVARATSYAERLRVSLAVIHGVDREDTERTDGRTSPPPMEGEIKDWDANGMISDFMSQDGEILRRPKLEAWGANGDDQENIPKLTVSVPTHRKRASESINSSGLEPEPLTSPFVHNVLDFLPALQEKEKPPLNLVGNVNGKIAIIVDDIIDDVDDYVTAAELLHSRGAYKVYLIATHGLLTGNAAEKIEQSLLDEVVVTNTVPHEVQKMQCHKIRTVDISPLLAEAIRRIHNGESMIRCTLLNFQQLPTIKFLPLFGTNSNLPGKREDYCAREGL
ncbi:phosphoribosyl pyrophosphokinase [Echinococcus multilocularis]|uniref:Phosphoribosyl pyrophosphokinase n=1 Tax=Echinococcus multilocularis TaxID=6211 RepID=A0A068YA42_ECHMU|nr:phosphoribosyl pyrophosphokinase [Echinococcus multilocularis]